MEVFSVPLPDLPIPSIKCELSFQPYLAYIEEQRATTKSEIYKSYLDAVIKLFYDNPTLLEPIKDLHSLEDHSELLELLKITHVSQVEGDNPLHSLGIPSTNPMMMHYFSSSEEFKSFFSQKKNALEMHASVDMEQLVRELYIIVLYECYGIGSQEYYPTQSILQAVDESGKIKEYYKVIRRNTFAKVVVDNELPPLKQEWVDYVEGSINSYSELKEPLPLEQFTAVGFFLFSIEDDTEEIALAQLSDTAAKMHTYNRAEAFTRMKDATLSLLGNEHFEFGFLPFLQVNGEHVYHHAFEQISIVFGKLKNHMSKKQMEETFGFFTEMSSDSYSIQSALHNNIYEWEEECEEGASVRDILLKEGLQTLTFVPIWNQDTLLGIVEIGSQKPDQVDKKVLQKVELAAPFYREFFVYKASVFNEYMKSFIMKKYTSIQPSVAWKFNKEVWELLKDVEIETEEMPGNIPRIKFENLHPFYGAVDYRNSSAKQLQAIHSDYLLQLDYLKTLLQEDELLENDSVVDFINTIDNWEVEVESGLTAEEEYEIHQFLEKESVDFLRSLYEQKRISEETYQLYVKDAQSKTGIFHLSHNDYEDSLQQLNGILKGVLGKSQESLAIVIPHYFEKFQTDGVEYSLYAGKSIDPSKDFPVNVNDIVAEWQVETMLRMALAANEYKNRLSIPLETTQLILIHEQKVDISYRIDEKHFDVEGSYSIRYEVMKKRIDKVRLLNSNERLTQPGKIAIVYAHHSGYKPYLDKIKELVKAGALEKEIEYLDLEQLQGIGKLKAIRVKINYHNAMDAIVESDLEEAIS